MYARRCCPPLGLGTQINEFFAFAANLTKTSLATLQGQFDSMQNSELVLAFAANLTRPHSLFCTVTPTHAIKIGLAFATNLTDPGIYQLSIDPVANGVAIA